MTTPRRWYQLSMLQMLVAMAVVALLVTLNMRVRRVEVLGMWVANESELEVHQFVFSAGWPFTAIQAQAPGAVNSTGLDDLRALQATRPSIYLGPLTGNISVGVFAVACAVVLVGRFTSKHSCPSPST